MRLSTRIAVLCAAAVLPSLVIQAWHEVQQRAARTAELHAAARRFALQSAGELDGTLEGGRHLLLALAETPPGPGCERHLARVRERLPRYRTLAVVDVSGQPLCAAGPLPAALAPPLAGIPPGAFHLGGYGTLPGGAPVLPLVLGLDASQGGPRGIVALLDLSWLSGHLAGMGVVPAGGSITVADREGRIVARTPDADRFVGTRIPDPFRWMLDARIPGTTEVTSQDGTRRVLGYVPLSATPHGLYVSAGFALDAAFVEIDTSTRRAMVLIAAGFISALVAAWLFGRLYLRDPLDRLLEAMSRWREGDRSARADAAEGWEVGRLAAGFNTMADAIVTREAALREGEARLRDVLEQMPVGVVLAEVPSGRILFRNARAAALLADVAGGGEGALGQPLARAAAAGETTEGLELPLLRMSGEPTWIAVSSTRIRASGGPPLAVAAFLDIGARKHAERQQELLTAELRHRVKNALAVVQAVAAQTMASSGSIEEFRTAFTGRLRDLARAQDALFAAADGRVGLRWLLEAALAPFSGGTVELAGAEVSLPARQTLSMALVMHELATNAAKHGALKPGGAGRLTVTWRVVRLAGGEAELSLQWRERSATGTARLETGRGFGARLVSRCVAHDLRGTAECRPEADGLLWAISFPLPEGSAPAADARTAAA